MPNMPLCSVFGTSYAEYGTVPRIRRVVCRIHMVFGMPRTKYIQQCRIRRMIF
uniref:Uncharacterized protein n=1 Tax=Arundo donax TaxID=35708 RepID=A0A0A9BEX8_ARUDO